MRIVLTMVGITLGISIAVVAGVYGWQQYASTQPLPAQSLQTAQGPTVSAPVPVTAVTSPAPKPVTAAPVATAAPKDSPKPVPQAPTLPKAPMPAVPQPSVPAAPAVSPPPAPSDPTAAQPKEAALVATPEKLETLRVGMLPDEVEQAMGMKGVPTPEDQVPAYQPEGWEEVRWPNPDGSYIAALFNQDQKLVHIQPFNMPDAYTWMANPNYAIPAWLNERMQTANMIVRVPAVEVVEPQAGTHQFQGPLVNADGQFLGTISGTYYTGEAAKGFARGIEGTYQYTLPNGQVDSNTFTVTE